VIALSNRAAAKVRRSAGTRLDSLVAGTLQGWAALSKGDTVRALKLYRVAAPISGDDHPESQCAERMVAAEIHLVRGEYMNAIQTASLIDAPAAVSCIIYLPRSLRLRVRAARSIADAALAAHSENRLASLRLVQLAP
jgi:hypothetical protein